MSARNLRYVHVASSQESQDAEASKVGHKDGWNLQDAEERQCDDVWHSPADGGDFCRNPI